jgi:hypothetical protein
VSGAAPAVALAEIVTLGDSAFAGATPASIASTTTLAARNTHQPYTLIRSASSPGRPGYG